MLGKGGSGAIIRKCSNNGLVFVGKITNTKEIDEEGKRSIENEINIMMQLNHPNIVHFIGSYKTPKSINLFMEMYSGTLSDYLEETEKAGKMLSSHQIVDYGLQIAKGLSYLHNLTPPIIHRDLKSGNVFAVKGENGIIETLKIGDFDTAKHLVKKAKLAKKIGTEGFMAPEVCRNDEDEPITDKSDGMPPLILFC